MLSAIILDIVVLALVVGCALYYRRKGFATWIVGLLGIVLALAGAYAVSRWLAPQLFEALFRDRMITGVTKTIAEQGGATVDELLEQIAGFLPNFVLDKVALNAGGGMVEVSEEMASFVVDSVVKPLVVPVIQVVLFLIVFLILRILCALLGRVIIGAAKAPIMGGVNRVLGLLAGIVIGLLYALLLVIIIWGLDAAFTPQQFGRQYFGTSIVYRFISTFNPFLT